MRKAGFSGTWWEIIGLGGDRGDDMGEGGGGISVFEVQTVRVNISRKKMGQGS